MIKAIFTNIKNEHRYLPQWIEYHIRLGFNKFIIYEDEGSVSHESILNQYNKVVNIDFYDYVLKNNSDEFKDVTCFNHILSNYNDIDWLIKLDPDEYIFLPGDSTIDDLLYNVDESYNQISLKWKLYNANGYIEAPNDWNYNLIDTYIHKIELKDLADYFTNNVSKNSFNIGKSFVRYKNVYKQLKYYNDDIQMSTLFPHYIINVDDTTLDGDKIHICIRHYITKSFEEYYLRLRERGEYNKTNYRKLGDFFVLNPDMIKDIPKIESEFNVDVFKFETKLN